MAIEDLLKRLQSPEAFQEVIGEQAIPYAPGVTEEQIMQEEALAKASGEFAQQQQKQDVADAIANDIVAAPNIPVEEQQKRESTQAGIQNPAIQQAYDAIPETYEPKPEQTEVPPVKSKEEELLSQIKAMRGQSDEDLQSAKNKDALMALLGGLNKGAGLIAQGRAMKSSQTPNLKMIGGDFKPSKDFTSEQMKVRQQEMDNLLKQYGEMKKGQLTPKDRAYLEEQVNARKSREAIAKDKLVKKPKETFEEKERIKADIKQKLVDEKERKKELKTTKESIKNVDEQLEKIKRAKMLMADIVKKGNVVDTGPLDQYATGMTKEGQKLRQSFNDLSLDKMTKMFQGMSKAIDSDAERKMFEQSQASLSNYPDVNMEVLNNMEKALRSSKEKNIQYMQNDLMGEKSEVQTEAPYGDTVEKEGKSYKWNPSAKKYQLVK